MKTVRLFLFSLFLFAFTFSSFADWGHFKSGITTSTPYASGEYHHFTKINGDPGYDFEHSALGRFKSGDYLNVDSVRLWTFKNGGSDICGATMYYRVYQLHDENPGSYTGLNLPWSCNGNCDGVGSGSDQLWKNASPGIDFLSGITIPGVYVVEIYLQYLGNDASCGGGNFNKYDSQSGANYRAYFEYETIDSFTDGDFDHPTWYSNDFNNFEIINNSAVSSLTGTEANRTRTVKLNSQFTGGGQEHNYISTKINDWGTKQEWGFWHGRSYTPSTSSQTFFWLYSDTSNLNSPSANGYRLKFGNNGTPDVFEFQKVVAGTATTLATSTEGVANGLSDFGITFKVTRASNGSWDVYTTPLPQDAGETQLTPTAFGVSEGNLTVHLFSGIIDAVSPIDIEDGGFFGFGTTNTSNAAQRTGQEFDNIFFRPLPPDPYFTFTTSASTIQENPAGTATVYVELHHPSVDYGSSVDVVLNSGDGTRLNPTYSTQTLNWSANEGGTKSVSFTAKDNQDCDDIATLIFKLANPSGTANPIIGAEDTYTLTIIDDNMGYDNLLVEDFELSLPAAWVSTPASRWSRSNTDAVGNSGYSLSHNAFASTDSSSIAYPFNSVPLTGVTTTWKFQVRYPQDGTANNHWLTFLSANTDDLRDLGTVSGYAVGFNQNVTGGTSDPLCLFKVTNGVRTVLINSGLDWIDDLGSANAVSILVTLDDSGEWELYVDADGGFDNLTSYGTVTDLTHPIMNAFGIRFNFTNLFADLLKIDDISIEQKGCHATWYSQGNGNSNGVIWAEQPVGTPTAVNSGRYDRFIIQTGNNITGNGLWIANDISVESGATLTGQANTDIRMYGDWFNDGTFVRSTSKVSFYGDENQVIGGSAITRFYDLEVSNDGYTVTALDSVLIYHTARVSKGTFNVNGKVALYSNSLGSGSIGEIKAGAQVVGNLTLMRYMPSIPNQYGNWINLGNPIKNLTLAAWNPTITTTGYPGSNYPPPYSFINIKSYDETVAGGMNDGYVDATNSSNPMYTDKGYMIWLNGTAQNLAVKGEIQQGSFNQNLSYTDHSDLQGDGWNLMTNPYPSEVDWHKVAADLDGPKAYYVFNNGINSYQYWLTTAPENGSGTASRYIPHSQSFFVKVNQGSQYLKYQEDYKTNNSAPFMRTMGDEDNSFFAIQLERNGMMDENLLFFSDNALASYDAMDVLHLASPNENSIQMFVVSDDNRSLVQDTRPYNTEVSIPLAVKMPAAGNYRLMIPEAANLPAGACLYIEDIITGQSMQLAQGMEMTVAIQAPFEGVRFRVTGSAPAKITTSNATCHGVADGSIDVNVPASWSVKLADSVSDLVYVSNGSVTLDGLAAGSYQLEIINPNASCTSESKEIEISEPSAITSVITSLESVACNEGQSGSVAWAVNNTEWFSFEITDEKQNTVRTDEIDGTSYISEGLASGIYTIKVYTECSNQTLVADLRDLNAPIIEVNAPETVISSNEITSVWLDALVSNAQSVSWTLSNGQTGEGEMFEALIEEPGVYTYNVTAKGVNCEKTRSGQFEVKLAAYHNGENSTAISLIQEVSQLRLITANANNENAVVRVLDASGKLVINREINLVSGQEIALNTSGLSSGIYTVQVISGSDVLFTEKLFRK